MTQPSSRELAILGKSVIAGILHRIDDPKAVEEYVQSFFLVEDEHAKLLFAQTLITFANDLIGQHARDVPQFRPILTEMEQAFAESAEADRRSLEE